MRGGREKDVERKGLCVNVKSGVVYCETFLSGFVGRECPESSFYTVGVVMTQRCTFACFTKSNFSKRLRPLQSSETSCWAIITSIFVINFQIGHMEILLTYIDANSYRPVCQTTHDHQMQK